MNDLCGKVVIVVPCFNEFRRLDFIAFRTFAEQRPSVHFLLVNDGSKDTTATMAEKYLSRTSLHWQVIRQVNRGPSAARNLGWRAAKALLQTWS